MKAQLEKIENLIKNELSHTLVFSKEDAMNSLYFNNNNNVIKYFPFITCDFEKEENLELFNFCKELKMPEYLMGVGLKNSELILLTLIRPSGVKYFNPDDINYKTYNLINELNNDSNSLIDECFLEELITLIENY
jgi:hypothetical protein